MRQRLYIWLPLLAGIILVFFAFSNSSSNPASARFHHSFFTMGTQATVLVDWPPNRREHFNRLMPMLELRVRQAEKLLSRFDPDSDISRFNAAPPGKMLAVNPLTWMALTEAMRVYTLSDGAFDVTVLPVLKLYNWKNREATLFPTDAQIAAARAHTGMDKILWQREGMKIGKKTAGLEIDLGGVAKGLVVDLAADFLTRNGVTNAAIDIGGEQRLLGHATYRETAVRQNLGARAGNGKFSGETIPDTAARPFGRPWTAAIRAPRPAGKTPPPGGNPSLPTGNGVSPQILRIHHNCALATSGDYEQYFVWKNRRYSHIIDPRSGRPLCGGIVSATVVFPGACMTADALATAISVSGVQEGKELLAKFPRAAAWLILEDGETLHWPAAIPEKNPTVTSEPAVAQ